MRKIIAIVLVLLFGLVAFWIYGKLFPSDEALIRRTLLSAAEAVTVRPDDSGFDKLAAVNRLVNLCTADIVVSMDAPGIRSRTIQGADQIREAAAAVHGSMEELAVELMDIGVEMAAEQGQATAQFIARARVGGAADEVIQEFRVVLKQVAGSWKIHHVEPLRSLEM